jgi:hypothetical protein
MVDITIGVAMISPNGKTTINAHPDSVEYLLSKGWKEEATQSKDKLKSSSKTKNGE